MKPLVTVIIPTYNRASYVCEAIDSVLAQTYPSMEIFVIDDGSTDNTQGSLKRYGEKIICLKQDRGVCAARNLALSKAKGKYVAFLDDDDVWLPEKIEREVAFLETHEDCAFVFSGFRYFSDTNDDMGERRLTQYEKTTFDYLYIRNLIYSTSLVTMRMDCCREAGGFDESLPQSADYDLWLRVAKKHKFSHLDECLARYRIHATNMSKNLKGRIQVYRQIFNKPEISEDKSWWDKRVRMGRMYYYAATFFRRYHRYFDAGVHYLIALWHCPYIGYYYWPESIAHLRFTFLYRILRIYFLVPYCLLKAVFFPKKDIPSTTLVDV